MLFLFPLGSDSVKKNFIEKSISLIKSRKELNTIEEKKMRYGLEAFYNLITKTIVLFVLAILFDLVLELLVLTFIYSTLRLYGFGLHAKTSLQCWITTLPIYLGGCLIIKYLTIPNEVAFIIWIFSFVSFILFAPADTPSRPLIHKEKRIRAKILSTIIVFIYFLVFLLVSNSLLKNAILYALIMESISINPIIYRLCNIPFNNYKSFQKNMV